MCKAKCVLAVANSWPKQASLAAIIYIPPLLLYDVIISLQQGDYDNRLMSHAI